MIVDLTVTDIPLGGKASGLALMARAGLPVPPAVVVPAHVTDVTSAANQIAARFDHPLAVRSSAHSEDLAGASFAGQYDTVLQVAPEPGPIAEAIAKVRSSGARVAGYHHEASEVAVLIMPMIEALAAGVAFTRDPVTGEDHVVVEAVPGLADRLVAGEETAERWIVNAVSTRRVSVDRGAVATDTASAVADLARRCELAAGTPQDIEWAWDGSALHLLQSRPITTSLQPIPIIEDDIPPGPWMWDSTHDRVPKTTLTLSMFIPSFEAGSRRLVAEYGFPIDHLAARSIGGYMHILPIPAVGRADAAPPPPPMLRLAFALVPALRVRVKRATLALSERRDQILATQWHEEIQPRIEAEIDRVMDSDLTALDAEAVGSEFRDAIRRVREVFGWNMITDTSYLLPMCDLLEFITSHDLGDIATVTKLLAGSGRSEVRRSLDHLTGLVNDAVRDVVSAGGSDSVDRLDTSAPEFAAAYRKHLRRHGARLFGFDLEGATMIEHPLTELRLIVAGNQTADPNVVSRDLADRLRSRLNSQAALQFDKLLGEARRTYPIRETGEAINTVTWGICRLIAREIGRRMVAQGSIQRVDDVLYLETEEIESWLEDPTDLASLVAIRRGQRVWARNHPPALVEDQRIPDPRSFPPPIRRLMGTLDLVVANDSAPFIPNGETDGLAASAGTHTGPVRIASSRADLDRVEPGDVLIAHLTTSTWEVVFGTIGALVTEGGGQLSHAAIVAREYALPAVVGCLGAMERFTDGQLVTVDGTAGTVTPVVVA